METGMSSFKTYKPIYMVNKTRLDSSILENVEQLVGPEVEKLSMRPAP